MPYFFHDPVERLIDLAKQILASVEDIDEYIPAIIPTHYLAMEVNVVRVSALCLVCPVEIILLCILPLGFFIHCQNEVTKSSRSI